MRLFLGISLVPLLFYSLPAWSIIGGKPVAAKSFIARSTVLLANTDTICTATILSENTVLTARHCQPLFADGVVIFGLQSMQAEAIRSIVTAVLSPTADLAVVAFAGKLPEGFTPVRLDEGGALQHTSFARTVSAGYGIENFTDRNPNRLLRQHQAWHYLSPFHHSWLLQLQLWKGACEGDSGGPLFVRRAGQWIQIGVIHKTQNSFLLSGWTPWTGRTHPCAGLRHFVPVQPHITWIREAEAQLRASADQSRQQ